MTSLLVWALLAQPEPGCNIAGVVTHALTREPVPRAEVRLSRHQGAPTRFVTRTNAGGRFAAENIPAGTYDLTIAKAGFLTAKYEEFGLVSGHSVTCTAGQTARVEASLIAQGVITGRVLDEEGEPVEGVLVDLYRVGRSERDTMGIRTNDRGEYRAAGLDPGRYQVVATREAEGHVQLGDGPRSSYVPTWMPSTVDRDEALSLKVAAGQELGSADIRLRRVETYSVQVAVASEGAAGPDMVVLFPRPSTGSSRHQVRSLRGMNRTSNVYFDRNVPAGSYWLFAQRNAPPSEKAIQPVDVRRDTENLSITIRPAASVTARVIIEGEGAAARPRVQLRSVDPPILSQPPGTESGKDGLQFSQVLPLRYAVAGWTDDRSAYLAELRQAGQTLPGLELDFSAGPAPFEAVFRTDGGTVSGVVLQGDKPASRGVVLLLRPTGPAREIAVAGPDGRFELRGVPPGEYLAWALGYHEEEEMWTGGAWRKAHAESAVKVTIPPRGSARVELQLKSLEAQ